jgi:protein-disulfide isomerase
MLPPDKFMEFHRRVYAGRGTIDGARALEAAVSVGLDREKVIAEAQTEEALAILKSHADFGGAAKLIGTPAYVLNGVAIVGHPGLKTLQQAVAAVRQCKKVVC